MTYSVASYSGANALRSGFYHLGRIILESAVRKSLNNVANPLVVDTTLRSSIVETLCYLRRVRDPKFSFFFIKSMSYDAYGLDIRLS
ncbi:uncharacterized protein H6S33_006488 [Morchella sextelata]|uniref:uncharacterized protein n=1 Tax=Morchella sextelata TaxID=1174677 RepID=UPI001D044A62|nr:uncharacterized protein H6S33_006488 [Morchella sextelata]KAH0604820.1 hypothetical protein H6S33_006488 [Morchella sextelata]